MRFRTRSRCLPFLALFGMCACSGHVERGGSGEDGPPNNEASPTTPPSSSGPVTGEGDVGGSNGDEGDGDGDTTVVRPVELGGAGGVPLTPIDIDFWCPTGDQWETMFGDAPANLGGAPSAEECPRLPSTSYSESYCVATFASVEPIVLSGSGSCCYAVEMIYCR